MGYGSTLRGEILIHPPLTWEEYKDTPFIPNPHATSYTFLRVERATPVDGAPKPPKEGGPEFVAVALRGIEDQWSMYTLEEELVRFVAAFKYGHTFSGHLIRSGKEQGDVERFTIVNGELVSEQAELRWPDGTEVNHDNYSL